MNSQDTLWGLNKNKLNQAFKLTAINTTIPERATLTTPSEKFLWTQQPNNGAALKC